MGLWVGSGFGVRTCRVGREGFLGGGAAFWCRFWFWIGGIVVGIMVVVECGIIGDGVESVCAI